MTTIARRLHEPVMLLGEAATESRLDRLEQSGDLARYDVIHLATHAVVDQADPERLRDRSG